MKKCNHQPRPSRDATFYRNCWICGETYECPEWKKQQLKIQQTLDGASKGWREYHKTQLKELVQNEPEWDRKYDRGGASR